MPCVQASSVERLTATCVVMSYKCSRSSVFDLKYWTMLSVDGYVSIWVAVDYVLDSVHA